MRNRRIAILMHEKDDKETVKNYFIFNLIQHWREDGYEVVELFGTRKFVPADLIFVHVDLSVVPDSYLAFADRYPITINGHIKDIRKSTFSQGQLKPWGRWDGQVIIKSNRNYAGAPERSRIQRNSITRRIINRLNPEWFYPTFSSPLDYQIYKNIRDVPLFYFCHPGLIIQKFMPEMVGQQYCLRIMLFLGDHLRCIRLKGKHPIVNAHTADSIEKGIQPHPKILAMRDRLQFNYGKFDYVIPENKPILLDTNKTVGASGSLIKNGKMESRSHYYSKGLQSFLKG